MKPKLLLLGLVLMLVLALGAAGWWLASSHRTTPATRSLRPEPKPEAAVPVSAPFPGSPAKLVAVGAPAEPEPASAATFNPPKPAWTDIEVLVNAKEAYQRRVEAIGRLPARLSEADWQALKAFLLKPEPADNGQLGQVLKNQLLDELCAMEPPPGGLREVLRQMYGDRKQNEVLRDYALQHLATLDERAGQTGNAAVQPGGADQRVLWEALNETGSGLAGTALLSLERLSEAGAPIGRERLEAAALAMAGNVAAGEINRITAYQMCARLGLGDALPMIEAAAQKSPTLLLQISAVGALGLLGSTNDLPLLQSLLAGSDERLRLPVQRALGRIEQRFRQPSTQPGPEEQKAKPLRSL